MVPGPHSFSDVPGSIPLPLYQPEVVDVTATPGANGSKE